MSGFVPKYRITAKSKEGNRFVNIGTFGEDDGGRMVFLLEGREPVRILTKDGEELTFGRDGQFWLNCYEAKKRSSDF